MGSSSTHIAPPPFPPSDLYILGPEPRKGGGGEESRINCIDDDDDDDDDEANVLSSAAVLQFAIYFCFFTFFGPRSVCFARRYGRT